MERLEEIINDEENIGLDFIVHVQNNKELDELINVLVRNNFKIQLSTQYNFNELKRWMSNIGKDDNFDTCFRIRNRVTDKCVAYNPSVEHWRMFCNDILEIRDGELEFNEGDYTLETAKIEAKKIWHEINDEDYGDTCLDIFRFSRKMSEEEIVQWLLSRFK